MKKKNKAKTHIKRKGGVLKVLIITLLILAILGAAGILVWKKMF